MKWISAFALSSLALCFCACKPGASSKSAPYNSVGKPVTDASELTGNWTGRSSCDGATEKLTLKLTGSSTGKVEAVLRYDITYPGGIPSGTYKLHGTLKNGSLLLQSNNTTDWIIHPKGHGTVDLSGKINSSKYKGEFCGQPFDFDRK